MKTKIMTLLICMCCFISYVKAQSYRLQTLDGKEASINLYYKPASGILTVSSLQDTISIYNYMSVDTAIVLNNVFLQIDYAKRAGTNQDSMNQLLLYISNGKLCQALHVNSLSVYDMRPAEYSLFKLKALLNGHDIDSYKLVLKLHSEKKSKQSPALNHKYDKTRFLTFDVKNKVFCNSYEPMSGSYTFHDLIDEEAGKRKYVKNIIPVVKIERSKYYFINNNWYTRYKGDFYSVSL